jgi:hypothetical protein
MAESFFRLSLCGVVMAGLAGCGGISNSGGNPTTVTFTFSGTTMPTAVATQIGTGAYTQATLQSGSGTISLPEGETRYAIAYLCPPYPASGTTPPQYQVDVYGNSIQDTTTLSYECSGGSTTAPQGVATLQVDASAIPGASFVEVAGEDLLWSGSTLSFSTTTYARTYDIPVGVYDLNGNILAIRILRSQTVPGALNGGNLLVFSAADKMVPEPITYGNVPAGYSNMNTTVVYNTKDGSLIGIGDFQSQYSAVPAASVESGDYYTYFGGAFGSGTTPDQFAGVDESGPGGGAVVLNLPAPSTYAGPTPTAWPVFDVNYPPFSGYTLSGLAQLSWSQGTTAQNSFWVVTSANYQNGSTTMAIPDLTSLTGFIAPASTGTKVDWDVALSQDNSSSSTTITSSNSTVQSGGSYAAP